jgi:pilus assembly protein CpaC
MSVRITLNQFFQNAAVWAGLLMAAAFAQLAMAQETIIRASFLYSEREPVAVNVLSGQSCLIIFDQPIGRLAVSNTETAEAVVVSPNQMMVNGKASGRARFTTWSKDGEKFVFFDVDVRANLAQIDSQVRALFPNEDIRLSQANGSVVISGNVDPKVAPQIESVVQAAGFKTVNLLTQPVQSVMQVQLQLRLAEVSRNKLKELAATPAVALAPGQGGYANTGQGPWTLSNVDGGSMFGSVANTLNLFVMTNGTFTFLRALQQQGALRALAEPNVIAMNGQQASFLAGGELPVPILQTGGVGGSAVTIQWKEYGIRVNFKPNILDEQHIRLEIEPEVSTLDYQNAIRFNGFLIPALRTRKAKTGIELRDGQSFGIAGLLDNSETRSLAKIPVISSVPILGNLFKSQSFQKNETELVFIVTAKLTEPFNPDSLPNMKGIDGLKGTSPLGMEAPGSQRSVKDSGAPATGSMPVPASDAKGDAQPAQESAPRNGESPASSVSPEPKLDEAAPDNQDKEPAPKPAAAPPPQKVITKNSPQSAWRIRLPEKQTLTAQNAEGKTP